MLRTQGIGQVEERLSDLHARGFGERIQSQVPRALTQHACVRNIGHLDFPALQFEGQNLFGSRSLDIHLDVGACGTLKKVADLFLLKVGDVAPINALQHISELDAPQFCGFAFQEIHNGGAAVARFNARANAPVLPGLHEADILHFGFRKIPCVGVELGEHRLDASFHEFTGRQGVDVEKVEFPESGLHDFELLGHLEVVVFRCGGHGQHHSQGQSKQNQSTAHERLDLRDGRIAIILPRRDFQIQLGCHPAYPTLAVRKGWNLVPHKDEHHRPLGRPRFPIFGECCFFQAPSFSQQAFDSVAVHGATEPPLSHRKRRLKRHVMWKLGLHRPCHQWKRFDFQPFTEREVHQCS